MHLANITWAWNYQWRSILHYMQWQYYLVKGYVMINVSQKHLRKLWSVQTSSPTQALSHTSSFCTQKIKTHINSFHCYSHHSREHRIPATIVPRGDQVRDRCLGPRDPTGSIPGVLILSSGSTIVCLERAVDQRRGFAQLSPLYWEVHLQEQEAPLPYLWCPMLWLLLQQTVTRHCRECDSGCDQEEGRHQWRDHSWQ